MRATVVVLPVPRPAGDHRKRREPMRPRRGAGAVLLAEQPVSPSASTSEPPPRPAASLESAGWRRSAAPPASSDPDRAKCHETQRAARGSSSSPTADQRALRQLRVHSRPRPRQRGYVHRLVGVDSRRIADRRQVHIDVPQPRPANGESDSERHRSSPSAASRSPERHMDVRRGEHAGIVEVAPSPGARRTRPASKTSCSMSGSLNSLSPRSSTSLSPSTSPFGGCQANTPMVSRPPPASPRRSSPHEEVDDAGEAHLRVVAGNPPSQVAMQGRQIEQGLQPVVSTQHLFFSASGR